MKKKPFPKRLKIGGHDYEIKLVKGLSALGLTDYNKNIISIDEDSVESARWATLIHEILHATNATWGDTREGHTLLESISQQLYQVLSDNNLLNK